MPEPIHALYAFGPFELDPRERLLRREGAPVPLEPRVFETLLVLVRNAGHLLAKEELLQALWPDTVVAEANLARNIWLLRRALAEPEDGRRYVETVPRVGYRFTAAVRQVAASAPEELPQAPRAVPRRGGPAFAGSAVAVAILLAVAALLLGGQSRTPVRPAAQPANEAAAHLYAEGLERLRWFDSAAASERLQRAVDADPQYPLAHAALARAWSALGEESRARDEASKAFHLAASLPRAQQLAVEGSYRATLREWDKAIEAGRALCDLFPDDVESGLALAAAETSGGQAEAAFATVRRLRALPAPAGQDPRIDLAEATAAEAVGDFHRELRAALRAKGKATALEARLLGAASRRAGGWALNHLGEPRAALAEFTAARDLCAAAGDGNCAGRMLNNMAAMHRLLGDLAQARRLFEQVVEQRRAQGDRSDAARAESNLAMVVEEQGDLAAAQRIYGRSLTTFLELGDRDAAARAQMHVASVFHRQGHLAAAGELYRQAIATFRLLGDREGLLSALANLGDTLVQRGDRAGAQASFAEASALCRTLGVKRTEEYVMFGQGLLGWLSGDLDGARRGLEGALALARQMHESSDAARVLNLLGVLHMNRGDLAAARTAFAEALAARRALGERASIAATELALAELALAEGKPVEAAESARRQIAVFTAEKALDDEVEARILLARALLQQGDLAAARSAVEAAAAGAHGENLWIHLRLAICTARIEGAAPGPAARQAAASLAALQRQAKAAGLTGEELTAGLARGEVEILAGDPTAGRACLEELAQSAAAKGYALLARQALARRSAILSRSRNKVNEQKVPETNRILRS
jgi:DNA-binding winged helix-turn-helix (wHTH) protein/Tfp pilus assembly protein PilF